MLPGIVELSAQLVPLGRQLAVLVCEAGCGDPAGRRLLAVQTQGRFILLTFL